MAAKVTSLTKDIGRRIKMFRKLKKIDKKELIQHINIDEGTYNNIESGASASFHVYCEISKALSVPLDALLPDYATNSAITNSTDMQIFIETYNALSNSDQILLMNVIKCFSESRRTT
ncbi:MAG: helix-turn-helix domain-containing protein [Acetatifactor sp.]|nr:helix-turn-helix domain-containing protein [Acetatifactor sp.]